MALADTLLEPGRRPRVIEDCVALVDAEVASKGGVSGLAIKGGYKIVKALKPGLIAEAFDALLDEFTAKLDPFYSESVAAKAISFSAFAVPRSSEIAESLLGITDRRIQRAENRTIKKTYEKLRPYGKKNVEQAVPGIGRLIDRHTGQRGAS